MKYPLPPKDMVASLYSKFQKEKAVINPIEELIGIFGVLCDYLVDNGRCDVFCPYAKTKDKDDECEAWRTIQKIRQEEQSGVETKYTKDMNEIVEKWNRRTEMTIDEVVATFWTWLQEQYEEAAVGTKLECGQKLERVISYPNSEYEIVFRKKREGERNE